MKIIDMLLLICHTVAGLPLTILSLHQIHNDLVEPNFCKPDTAWKIKKSLSTIFISTRQSFLNCEIPASVFPSPFKVIPQPLRLNINHTNLAVYKRSFNLVTFLLPTHFKSTAIAIVSFYNLGLLYWWYIHAFIRCTLQVVIVWTKCNKENKISGFKFKRTYSV